LLVASVLKDGPLGRQVQRLNPGVHVIARLTGARGDGEVHDVVLRPTDEYGIRYWARIGPCGPPRAALLVLGDGRRRLR